MHSSEVKEDTHDSFRRITAEVICAGENELRVRVAAPSLLGGNAGVDSSGQGE